LTYDLVIQPQPRGSRATGSEPQTPVIRVPGPTVGASARAPPRWPPPPAGAVWLASCPPPGAATALGRWTCIATSATHASTRTFAEMIKRLVPIAASSGLEDPPRDLGIMALKAEQL